MSRRRRWGVAAAGMVLALVVSASASAAGKYAIILQAGQGGDGLARALHALLYAKELKEHGHEVVLIFDGAGTTWAEQWTDPDRTSKYKEIYEALREQGVIEVVCDYCATAFKVKERLAARKAPFEDEYDGHPSVAKWADQGYELIVL